jgi:DNA-binding GntR family transcriptional regulator
MAGVTYKAIAYEYIRRSILDGLYLPGASLVEAAIAEELGTSRTPVREAIRELGREGLIEIAPHKGARVKVLSSDDLLDIFDIKIRVEGLCAASAARRSGPATAAKLFEATAAMEAAAKANNRRTYLQADEEYHRAIYEGAKSERARHIVEGLNAQWHRMRQGMAAIESRMQTSAEEHRRIAAAIEAGNAELAETAMREHLEQLRDEIDSMLREFSLPMDGVQ